MKTALYLVSTVVCVFIAAIGADTGSPVITVSGVLGAIIATTLITETE